MHRHGYKGRKFHRETDQRRALIKSLAEALIINESIETTLPKAKEIVPYVEMLITKAKKGDLHNRRQVIRGLQTITSAHKLVDEIAPKLKGRVSGHLRIERTTSRRGDNTQLARVSFVDELGTTKAEQPQPMQKEKQSHETDKTDATKSVPTSDALIAKKKSNVNAAQVQAPKRTGRRGNR